MAIDYVWDSASILTSFREELSKFGVIFCSISEAIKEYPDLVRQHLGSVVSARYLAQRSESALKLVCSTFSMCSTFSISTAPECRICSSHYKSAFAARCTMM